MPAGELRPAAIHGQVSRSPDSLHRAAHSTYADIRNRSSRFAPLLRGPHCHMFAMLHIRRREPSSSSRVSEFKLANGMQVVVVPDHRAPVVTHMVWYRVGAADEPPGVSGIAHFLEHLMFKSTDKIPTGEFSKIVSRLGGQDNAFTAQDVTAYFQRIAKDRLPHGHGDGGRPHGQPQARREGSADRARRHPRGAPHAHREQSRPPSSTSRWMPRSTSRIPTASR